ncbi:surface protein SP1 [Fusarium mundagurra]|uniref:Surface protein SP1 n=1 Tax=Fusarium mundagurra TaxID=1567541 RepID=A0A8H5YED0_9HYPO|nr:surface protein SP1 [Fusarium mundagurra]
MKSTVAFFVVLAGSISARLYKRDECATACTDAYNSCRVEPDASQAFCAEDYERCLGFNPFLGSNSITVPTECSRGATGSSNTAAVESTSIINTRSSASSSAPAYGGSSSSPIGIDTKTSAVSTDTSIPETYDCVTECNDDYNTCRTAPDANMASCAAQYAQCLGYNPFNGGGSLVTPTACSVPASVPTQLTQSSSIPQQSQMASKSQTSQPGTTPGLATSHQQPIATCDAGACMGGTATDGGTPGMATEPPVIVDAGGSAKPWLGLVALAIAIAL